MRINFGGRPNKELVITLENPLHPSKFLSAKLFIKGIWTVICRQPLRIFRLSVVQAIWMASLFQWRKEGCPFLVDKVTEGAETENQNLDQV